MADVKLDMLQVMVQPVLDGQDRHSRELGEIKLRLSNIERGIASIRREAAGDAETIVTVQVQVDRLGERIERIERRLNLNDA
ncbi:MAG: hypothetical protein WCC64_11615 [Aliidongia sp.]